MAVKLSVEHFEQVIGSFRPRQAVLEVKDKDESKSYRLVSNNPNRIEYWKQYGYEVVTIKKGEDGPRTSSTGQVDQRHIVAGSYVLMQRARELSDAHRQALDRRAERKTKGPREAFRRTAAKHGVGTEDNTRVHVGPLTPPDAEE